MSGGTAPGGTIARTRIKMCGVGRLSDATMAVAAGVDALGFIFAAKSPRRVSPEAAREICTALPPFVSLVGVFVDSEPAVVAAICQQCRLSHVQLHGHEDPDYCRQLAAITPARLVKAFRVGAGSKAADFSPYDDLVSAYLLDTYVAGQEGGTGQTFDWQIIASLNLQRPVILAGGLNAANAAAAVRQVRPFAVDLNSGVEDRPGQKNRHKLQAVIDQIRLADACLLNA